MMSIGDPMLSPAGRLDKMLAQVKSPAMATPIVCGSTMINKTMIIQANRTACLLQSDTTNAGAAKAMPWPTPMIPKDA